MYKNKSDCLFSKIVVIINIIFKPINKLKHTFTNVDIHVCQILLKSKFQEVCHKDDIVVVVSELNIN